MNALFNEHGSATPEANWAVPPKDRARLSKQCRTILAMLRAGPVKNIEIVTIACNYSARISEIRLWMEGRGEMIPPPKDLGSGVTEYKIEAQKIR